MHFAVALPTEDRGRARPIGPTDGRHGPPTIRTPSGRSVPPAPVRLHPSILSHASSRQHSPTGASDDASGDWSRQCDLITEWSTQVQQVSMRQCDVKVLGRTIRRNQIPPILEPLGSFRGLIGSDIGAPLAVGYGSRHVYNSCVAHRLHPATARHAGPARRHDVGTLGHRRFGRRDHACSVRLMPASSHSRTHHGHNVAPLQSSRGATA